MPKEPSERTIKRLFASYGNQCAFPNCTVHLVDDESVLGEICHIKGNKPTAKRYDSQQSDDDRHGYGNLILLCGVHHKVVDDDDVAYTVERLLVMKRAHETKFKGGAEPSEGVVRQLLGKINLIEDIHATVVNGLLNLTDIQKAGKYMALVEAYNARQWYKARDLAKDILAYQDVNKLLQEIQLECEKLDNLGRIASQAYVAKDPITLVRAVRDMGHNATSELLHYAQKAWAQVTIPEPQVLRRELYSKRNSVVSLAITQDDRFLVAGFAQREIYSSDLTVNPILSSSNGIRNSYDVDAIDAATSEDQLVVFSPYSAYMAKGWYFKSFKDKPNSEFGLNRSSFDEDIAISALTLTPDKARLIEGYSNGSIWVADIVEGEALCSYVGHQRRITAFAVSANGALLISGSVDGTVRVWDLTACCLETLNPGQKPTPSYIHETLHTFTTVGKAVSAVAVTPNGKSVISAGVRSPIQVWNLETNEVRSLHKESDYDVKSLVVSPNGAYAITGATDGIISIWDLSEGVHLCSLSHPQDKSDYRRPTTAPIQALALSSDGRLLASGSKDGTVCLYELPAALFIE